MKIVKLIPRLALRGMQALASCWLLVECLRKTKNKQQTTFANAKHGEQREAKHGEQREAKHGEQREAKHGEQREAKRRAAIPPI
ncbi:MAG: hypothetical protein F6K47_34895 [Symploca sp. SIO2E6]|nr:hypothetical protein [Symploca sp. SIO2E6]